MLFLATSHRAECQDKFTVRVGTLHQRSHLPLHMWLLASHLMVASKKGIGVFRRPPPAAEACSGERCTRR